MQDLDHKHNIIEIENVSFSYGNRLILENITFNIHKGDYLGIIGPNGGGKTTLLKIVLGLLKPDKGKVKLFGKEIANFKDWYKIGYVAQKAVNFESNFPTTVEEMVAMGRYGKKGLFHMLDSQDKKIIEQSLRQVEMWEYRNRLIGDLSGGQQQRVFIARALSSKPEIILLDEPTTGVDVKTQTDFYTLLKSLNQNFNLTLVLVSHDINVVVHETTELACINRTLIYDRNPEDILISDQLKKMYGEGLKLVFHHH